jgi:hypothetical protein
VCYCYILRFSDDSVVASALHLCMFAFGKGKAARELVGTEKLAPIAKNGSECLKIWRYGIATLILPTLAALIAQLILSNNDWRLMGANIFITGTFVGLILVGCSRGPYGIRPSTDPPQDELAPSNRL